MRTRSLYFRMVVAVLCAALLVLLVSCVEETNADLVIYAYDSFASEWGPAPIVIPAFEKATGLSVELVVPGDSGQVLSRAIEEKDRPLADVLIGIDGNLLPKALSSGILSPYRPKEYEAIPSGLVLDSQWHITPYDYSSFAIMWDSYRLTNPPASLEDLTKPEYAKKLILMDPRTSTPGLGFLAWTGAVYGDDVAEYWRRLKPSILTMSPGWDTGYGLFTAGEAPLVISYTTSAAYHAEFEARGRYIALEFSDGHPVQIEGAGITKGARHRKAAEAFIDFMLSSEFQSALPLTNWMYPVMPGITLPQSYEASPRPSKSLSYDPARLESELKLSLDALRAIP